MYETAIIVFNNMQYDKRNITAQHSCIQFYLRLMLWQYFTWISFKTLRIATSTLSAIFCN